jgi:hypothetical protein
MNILNTVVYTLKLLFSVHKTVTACGLLAFNWLNFKLISSDLHIKNNISRYSSPKIDLASALRTTILRICIQFNGQNGLFKQSILYHFNNSFIIKANPENTNSVAVAKKKPNYPERMN